MNWFAMAIRLKGDALGACQNATDMLIEEGRLPSIACMFEFTPSIAILFLYQMHSMKTQSDSK